MLLKLRKHPRAAYALMFAVFFVANLVVLAGAGIYAIQFDLNQRATSEAAALNDFTRGMNDTIEALSSPPDAEPCSEPFVTWMRRVAFLPDGIHEIIYAPRNEMLCSVSIGRFETPVPLGQADFSILPKDMARVWLNRDLAQLGFPGMAATYASAFDFVLVVPDVELAVPVPDWVSYEIVNISHDGTIWHRKGRHGLYSHATGLPEANALDTPFAAGWSATSCDLTRSTCLALNAPFALLIDRLGTIIAGGIALAVLIASALTMLTRPLVEKAWSLPSRLLKNLSAQSIRCRYQPLLDLTTDRIWGVEVLARWQDDDGALVAPDLFLPIIVKHGLQRRLTRLVVDRAHRELSALPPGKQPLKVHFNIFPCEFDFDWMMELFKNFLKDASRFEIVIELVESDALPIESTRQVVVRLRDSGIRTFIDDFGEGYSSIGYLAGLGTSGVKLDRSFGQSPEGSLMEAMMMSAIEMVDKTGQTLVVEGVETASRLAALKRSGKVDVAQGFFLSRPIPAEDLRPILIEGRLWSAREAA